MIKRAPRQLCFLGLFALAASWASAEQPQGIQLITILQNERTAVPYTSLVSIDPAEEIRMRMALASDLRADRIARQAAGGDSSLVSVQSGSVDYPEVRVTLIGPDLQKRKLQADGNGVLRLASLVPGLNVLVATGANTHAVKPIFVKMRTADEPQELGPDGDQSRVMSLVAATGDEILPVVESYAPSGPSDELGTLDEIAQNVVADEQSNEHVVRLSGEGKLAGQIISLMQAPAPQDLAQTNVVLFQRGLPIARGMTDDRGRFEFSGVAPDVYGIVAAGPAGYTAFSFEAVPSDGLARRRTSDGYQLVSLLQGETDVLPVVMVPPPMVPEVVETINDDYDELYGEEPPAMADFGTPSPGFGGGGAGGGGSGAGGGGVGGGGDLGALGIVAAAAAIAASNNGDGIGVSNVTSPAIPPIQ